VWHRQCPLTIQNACEATARRLAAGPPLCGKRSKESGRVSAEAMLDLHGPAPQSCMCEFGTTADHHHQPQTGSVHARRGSEPGAAAGQTSVVAGQRRFRRLLPGGEPPNYFAQLLPKCRGNAIPGQLGVDDSRVYAALRYPLAVPGRKGEIIDGTKEGVGKPPGRRRAPAEPQWNG
jgi:hypothetical protein